MPHHTHRRLALATIALPIGTLAAAVTVKLFTLALLKTEADESVRTALTWLGILFVSAEMGAFMLRGLLSREFVALRRLLLSLGLGLMAFECATVYVTQATVVAVETSVTIAQAQRITTLKAQVVAEQHTAELLRETAKNEAVSPHSWVQARVRTDLASATAAEAPIASQSVELAKLQAAAAPTLANTLGQRGMTLYIVVRALLLTAIGAAMFSVLGASLQRTEETDTQGATESTASTESTEKQAVSLEDAPGDASTLPAEAVNPMQSMQCCKSQQDADAARFERVRDAVKCGAVRPSLRALQKEFGASQAVAQRYLRHLEQSGVIARVGQGYEVAPARAHLRIVA